MLESESLILSVSDGLMAEAVEFSLKNDMLAAVCMARAATRILELASEEMEKNKN